MFKIESAAVKIILLIACAVIFCVFYAPTTVGIRNLGNIVPMAVCVAGALFVIFNSPVSAFLSNIYKNSAGKALIIGVCTFLIAGLLYVTVLSVLMIKAQNDMPENQDTVIVLGCKVNGTNPSLMLAKRLDKAAEYLSGNDAKVIVSGSQGQHESISEAEAMRTYLIECGIDEKRIIIEDKSTSTEENFEFSVQKLSEYGLSSDITIITNGYHQLRSQMIAKKFDLNTTAIASDTSLWLLPTYWVREWFGITKEFFFG